MELGLQEELDRLGWNNNFGDLRVLNLVYLCNTAFFLYIISSSRRTIANVADYFSQKYNFDV